MSVDGSRFPLDLEREIFEIAAAINPKTIATLLRVCHRIHAWIEPLLYSVIIATTPDDPVFDAIQHKSPTFLRNAVHHLITAFGGEGDGARAPAFASRLTSNDARAVVMAPSGYKQDWEKGVRGGDDFWVRAEAFRLHRESIFSG
ncbi:hypothetical protein B0H16DRAFT_1619667 [Mycena metata]|uniref:F-box domain-containing protein n=1 Tax=Mycena metata TaxID=1033252 RepID=A0AAD7MEK8_9AGAR|nr:hypothetical protein B0H16DRAFT_1619667 [Mycena metata]